MRSAILAATTLVLLFSGAAHGGSFRVIHDFCAEAKCADGSFPYGSLAIDPQGNLYGTAQGGGTAAHGTVYELNRGRGKQFTLKTLYSYCKEDDCPDGYEAEGVIRDISGNLYGVMQEGGTSHDGLAYELAPRRNGEWKHTILKTFDDSHGGLPLGTFGYAGSASGLPYDGASPLYGTTHFGGTDPLGGTVFTLTPEGAHWKYETIFNFTDGADDNSEPAGAPVLDASGNLFGTTTDRAAGEIYELIPGGGGWSEQIVYTPCFSCNDKTYGPGELAIDAAGTLIGGMAYGGPYCTGHSQRCGGGIYKLAPAGTDWDYTALYDFCAKNKQCRDGNEDTTYPAAPVIDASGNIYGTVSRGGKHGFGVLFRIGTDGTYEDVHDFCALANCSDGSYPHNLVMAADGVLYGIATQGGNGAGAVFEFKP